MSNNRILSFQMSQELTKDELQEISASGMTQTMSGHGSYGSSSGYDAQVDTSFDF